jgi:hypothetical protein
MVKKAVLVGINYFSVPSARLNGCINDIQKMKSVLIQKYGYLEQNIILLSDNNSRRMPTLQNIVICIQALVASSANCEEIFFHYSGHGSQMVDRSGDEKTGMDSVIVPVDFQKTGVVSDDALYQLFQNAKCPLIMLFDSCHSGSVCDLPYSYQWDNTNPLKMTENNNMFVSNPHILMISGCRDDQTSADAYFPATREYGGACTTFFLDALNRNGYNGSIIKIYNDMCQQLVTKYTQLPILSSSSKNISYVFRTTSSAKRELTSTASTKKAKKVHMQYL